MDGARLCLEAWAAVGLVAGMAVLVCLGAIGRALEGELHRQALARQVRALRKKYSLRR